MTVQDAAADPNSQLMDQTLPALAQMEASLADELEASRLAVHSANLLDTLTNLGHAITEESEQLDALDLIAPDRWAAKEFHSRIISWLLDPSAHHGQARHFIVALLNSTMAPPRLLNADWSVAQVSQEWENVVDRQRGFLDILILNHEHHTLHLEPDYIFEPADYGPGWDDGSARRKIEDWIDKFANEKFPEMNRIIVDCLRRHHGV